MLDDDGGSRETFHLATFSEFFDRNFIYFHPPAKFDTREFLKASRSLIWKYTHTPSCRLGLLSLFSIRLSIVFPRPPAMYLNQAHGTLKCNPRSLHSPCVLCLLPEIPIFRPGALIRPAQLPSFRSASPNHPLFPKRESSQTSFSPPPNQPFHEKREDIDPFSSSFPSRLPYHSIPQITFPFLSSPTHNPSRYQLLD